MNRKKYFFTVIFLIPFLIFCQESNGVKIVHPDARDSSYSFIGEWKITETFKLFFLHNQHFMVYNIKTINYRPLVALFRSILWK